MPEHSYEVAVRWTGNRGAGTSGYRSYDRAHEVSAAGKATIAGSSDPAFRGDAERWNPEELLLASLSQCHLLWYLHLAALAGIVVTGYLDQPIGRMAENPDGSGQFIDVLLRPRVTVAEPGMIERAQALHEQVNPLCFIARSVNFPVRHETVTDVVPG
ncbi:MAG: OsmC family protein [Actinomycetota bacterium]|nr:OsmC family protein [Actinomycetota bacterium]